MVLGRLLLGVLAGHREGQGHEELKALCWEMPQMWGPLAPGGTGTAAQEVSGPEPIVSPPPGALLPA